MKVLIACEFSGIVRDAFIAKGHDAISCDLLPTERPGPHIQFFMKCYDANAEKVCVENPVGYMNTIFRKPDQIIHPYFFGVPVQKRTCLWVRNLPILEYEDTIIEKPKPLYICQGEKCKGKAIHWVEGIRGVKNRSKARSETFPCIADAMAAQWSEELTK